MQAHYQRKVLSQLAYCRGEGVALCEAVDEGGGEALPVMLCSDTFAALVGVEGAARGSRGKAAAAGAGSGAGGTADAPAVAEADGRSPSLSSQLGGRSVPHTWQSQRVWLLTSEQ